MTFLVSTYLSIQILLTLVYILVVFFDQDRLKLDFQSLLNFAYISLGFVFCFAILIVFTPGENPFGPVAKFWTEGSQFYFQLPGAESVGTHVSVSQKGMGLPFAALSNSWALGALLLVLFWTFKAIGSFRGFSQLKLLVKRSHLIRKVGGVEVYYSEEVNSPMSFFDGKARVLLPESVFNNHNHFKIALWHELQHHRQKDTLWVYALEAVRIIFGLNPLVAKLINKIQVFQELACDQALIANKGVSAGSYGECLYDFARKQQSVLSSPVGALGMATQTQHITRRVKMMFQGRNKASILKFRVIVLLGVAVLFCGAWGGRGLVSDKEVSLKQVMDLVGPMNEDLDIPIIVNRDVVYWLNKAIGTEKSRKYMRDSLERMRAYEPMIRQRLKQASLPESLLAVPLVESGYRNEVVSPAKAAGIWQFIPGTARFCGLTVNKKNDERKNPEMLTTAAICYYQKLFAVFQNWPVALTSYNTGQHAMTRAIVQAGHNDIFKLGQAGHLGAEGGSYLGKIMAAMIILKNPSLVR